MGNGGRFVNCQEQAADKIMSTHLIVPSSLDFRSLLGVGTAAAGLMKSTMAKRLACDPLLPTNCLRR